jgi:hypothetical protein
MRSVIFALEFGWSIMTMCTFWVKNWQSLVRFKVSSLVFALYTNRLQVFIRFMVGLFESAYYPGMRECQPGPRCHL